MFSPSSAISDSVSFDSSVSSVSSSDSSTCAQRWCSHGSGRYSKENRNPSQLLMKHGLQLGDNKRKLQRKKHAFKERVAAVSKKELNEMKNQHEKELKNLLTVFEKESLLLTGIAEKKKEELSELRRQHEREVEKLFAFQEKELALVIEQHDRKQSDLEESLDRSQTEAFDELRRRKEQISSLEKDLEIAAQKLKSLTQKSGYEMRKLKDELNTSVSQTSFLEDQVQLLREKLAEKDTQIRDLEGINSKSSYVEEELRDELRWREEEIRRKDRTIIRQNEKIQSISSRLSSGPEQVEDVDAAGYEWEDSSGLTNSSDFELRERPVAKTGVSSDSGRKMSYSSSMRRENRDELETRKLSVSFSDEVDKCLLPMQVHDKLSRKLEQMCFSE